MEPAPDLLGRPWNMNQEQEAKLKEMWIGLLSALGTFSENDLSLPSRKESAQSNKSATTNLQNKISTHTGNLSPVEAHEAFWSIVKHHHPDAVMLRFLRARDWHVDAALQMLPTALHWMTREMDVHNLLRQGEAHALEQTRSADAEEKQKGEEFLGVLRKGVAYVHGVDLDGRPCLYVRPRVHSPSAQSAETMSKLSVFIVETIGMMFQAHVDTATLVFDLSGVGISNADLSHLSFLANVFNKNYPETLGHTLIYRPPWLFHTIWKVVKVWLPRDTAAKFMVLSTPEELAKYLPHDHIPKELGGSEDWEWQYIDPTDDQPELAQTEERDRILVERKAIQDDFDRETVAWLAGKDNKKVRDELAERLAKNYWILDPYVRARTVYDRAGIIRPRGLFGPNGSSAEKAA